MASRLEKKLENERSEHIYENTKRKFNYPERNVELKLLPTIEGRKVVQRCKVIKNIEPKCSKMPQKESIKTKKKSITNQRNKSQIEMQNISAIDSLKYRQKICVKYRSTIGQLQNEIMSSPSEKISLLERMISCSKDAQFPSMKKYGIIKLTEVFVDIVPGYHVRELTEMESSVKVSRDIKIVREFESKLLMFYKLFVDLLFQTFKENLSRVKKNNENVTKPDVSADLLLRCSAEAISALITNLSHFNCFEQLCTFAVKHLWLAKRFSEIGEIFQNALKNVISVDNDGQISLAVVKAINAYVKNRIGSITPNIIEILMFVEIPEESITLNSDSKIGNEFSDIPRGLLSKKQKKIQKISKSLNRDLQDAQLVENDKKVKAAYSQILNLIFAIYLRILRSSQPSPHLLTTAIDGIGKFSHLLNVEFFGDILIWLSKISSTTEFSPLQSLKTSLTVLRILQEKGRCLSCVDHNLLLRSCYINLLESITKSKMGLNSSFWENQACDLYYEFAERILIKWGKELGARRMCAMIKRFLTISLTTAVSDIPSKILTVMKNVFEANMYDISQLFDIPEESGVSFTSGMNVDDPEFCAAEDCTLWEYQLLARHFNPEVSHLSRIVSRIAETKFTSFI